MKRLAGFNKILCALIFVGLISQSIPLSQALENEKGVGSEQLISPDEMMVNLERVLAKEQDEYSDLVAQLKVMTAEQDAIMSEINIYNFQNTATNQLLLVTRPRIEALENAIEVNRLGYRALSQRVEQFQKQWDMTMVVVQQTADRIDLAQKELVGIRQSQISDVHKQQLALATQKVVDVLMEKRRLGEKFQKIHENLLGQMRAAMDAKKALADKMGATLDRQKKTSLFQRSESYLRLNGGTLQKELQFIRGRIQSVFSAATWNAQLEQVKKDRVDLWGLLLLALVAVLTLQGRWRKALERLEKRCEGPEYYHRRLVLILLRRSLPYLCMTLLFWIYTVVPFSFFNFGLRRVLFKFFLLLLVTRWGLDYLKYGLRRPIIGWRLCMARHLKQFFRFYRLTFSVVILLFWAMGMDSFLTFFVRGIVSVVILCWAIVFWQRIKPIVAKAARDGQAVPNANWVALLQGWTYIVAGGSLFLNFGGYSLLAGQWFLSWTESVVLLFWGLISYNVIREFQRGNRDEIETIDNAHTLASTYQLRWSLIRLAWIVWFFGLIIAFFQIWDPTGFLRSWFLYFFDFVFTIGNIKLNIKGIVFALAILFVTQLAVRIGKALIREKILDKQSYEIGFKDSIVTITGYLAWGFGLLMALAVIGFNATSLAVVFGALSVGIGFGLQNIFNNFISGLILLFERPIQVGDYVEVNGLWAEVKKINVRATVVQTFDNASVIIPNSELISQQVTNWSFKDKRMRRNIEVGVAYGSDIDLVQRTMLDIPKAYPRVLNHPKPEVLFIDHADSALIFRLRIWVHVEDYWVIASKIRGEMDKRFRELGIEIAFPQRDLHIRTIPRGAAPAESVADSGSASPNQPFATKKDG